MSKVPTRLFNGLLGLLVSAPLVASAREHDDGREVTLAPNGAVADSGWALARLNDGGNLENQSFAYPETTEPVRLYLVDSGIAHGDTWFAANPKLVIEHVELVRGSEDPETSDAVEHGTRMLSLIAGPETGAALGTPLHVVNFNIYPNGEGSSTTSGRVAAAIDKVIEYQLLNPGMPGVICLASGSSFPGAESGILEGVIEEAKQAGITVIVSAGNEGGDAGDYIPSAYGIQAGIICVGASNANNQHLASTNSGAAVDLFAPGEGVRTLSLPVPEPGSYYLMNGTSPATALATAAAIIELSKNPGLSPEEVEEALTSRAYPSVPKSLVQVRPDPDADSDGDGIGDVLEIFFGSNPADALVRPAPLAVSRPAGQARVGFTISASLFNPADPYVLSNGATWRIRCSEDLTEWRDATGTLVAGEPDGPVIPVTFTMPAVEGSCFFQIEVKPAP